MQTKVLNLEEDLFSNFSGLFAWNSWQGLRLISSDEKFINMVKL